MKNLIVVALGLLFLGAEAFAQKRVIEMLPGERWWGAVTDLGVSMPFDASTDIAFDMARHNFNNQTTPMLSNISKVRLPHCRRNTA